ncbi:MAG: hypothetical protein LBD41_03135 [Clostridiales Family XIII bacterium]|jgi:hypothetical protein|nr:hypothetical protein [Clostridiales Family XIII bacterium]
MLAFVDTLNKMEIGGTLEFTDDGCAFRYPTKGFSLKDFYEYLALEIVWMRSPMESYYEDATEDSEDALFPAFDLLSSVNRWSDSIEGAQYKISGYTTLGGNGYVVTRIS